MNDSCRNYRDQLVEAAEGKATPELARHLETCAKCTELVRRYREMIVATQQAWEPAPRELISLVKSLMPSGRRTVVARRLGTSLLAGARGPSDEFQVIVGTDDVSIRLMASKGDRGWQLMGRLPQGEWQVQSAHPAVMERDGFRLAVPSLEDSEFSLIGPDQTIEVPSITELLADDAS